MDRQNHRAQFPWWVRVGIWGLRTRRAVMTFVWLSVLMAVAMFAYAAWSGDPRGYAGVVFLASAFMYWQAIVWMDARAAWDCIAPGKGRLQNGLNQAYADKPD